KTHFHPKVVTWRSACCRSSQALLHSSKSRCDVTGHDEFNVPFWIETKMSEDHVDLHIEGSSKALNSDRVALKLPYGFELRTGNQRYRRRRHVAATILSGNPASVARTASTEAE